MNLLSILTHRQLEALPLQVLHAALERREREIEEILANYQERSLIPGEGYRAKWDRLRDPEDLDKIHCIDQTIRHEYATLAKLCRRREQQEIEALRAEFRQSADPAIAQVIAEAIDIERKLP